MQLSHSAPLKLDGAQGGGFRVYSEYRGNYKETSMSKGGTEDPHRLPHTNLKHHRKKAEHVQCLFEKGLWSYLDVHTVWVLGFLSGVESREQLGLEP